MLIVSHALHCVNGHYLYSTFDSLVNCLVSVLDNHISVKQLMSIRNLKNDSILIICVLQCTRLSKKAHAAFDQGRGFEAGGGGRGRN